MAGGPLDPRAVLFPQGEEETGIACLKHVQGLLKMSPTLEDPPWGGRRIPLSSQDSK